MLIVGVIGSGCYRLGGFLLPATHLAAVAGMTAVLSLTDLLAHRRSRFTWSVFLISLVLMGGSLGRGGMLGAAVSMIIVLAAFRRIRLAVGLGCAAALVFLIAPGLLDLSWELLSRRQDSYQIATITGRVPLWQKAIELIEMKPVLGWGYVSGSRVAFLSAFKGWPAVHTHNVFLEILVTLGALGLCILLGALWNIYAGAVKLLRAGWNASRPAPHQLASLKSLALVTLLTVAGMFDAGYAGAPRFEAVIMIGAVFTVDLLRRHAAGAAPVVATSADIGS